MLSPLRFAEARSTQDPVVSFVLTPLLSLFNFALFRAGPNDFEVVGVAELNDRSYLGPKCGQSAPTPSGQREIRTPGGAVSQVDDFSPAAFVPQGT